LEDEDPELIVEIVAKPGRRWELFGKLDFVNLVMFPQDFLVQTMPRVSKRQLVSAKSFVGRMLTQNQVARDSGVRGPVDLFEQRRQLQRQDRELEQAIEKWKTIESLSRVVFQQTQVEFQAITPVTPQEQIPKNSRAPTIELGDYLEEIFAAHDPRCQGTSRPHQTRALPPILNIASLRRRSSERIAA
jgi:hypothetical protein